MIVNEDKHDNNLILKYENLNIFKLLTTTTK